jgi:hypothetical protein
MSIGTHVALLPDVSAVCPKLPDQAPKSLIKEQDGQDAVKLSRMVASSKRDGTNKNPWNKSK